METMVSRKFRLSIQVSDHKQRDKFAGLIDSLRNIAIPARWERDCEGAGQDLTGFHRTLLNHLHHHSQRPNPLAPR